MNVDSKLLLPKLGVKVEHKLSHAQKCPVCRNEYPSLIISRAPVSPGPYYVCTACDFKGDAVDLVAASRNIEPSEALDLFDHTGELADLVRRGSQHISQYVQSYKKRQQMEQRVNAAVLAGNELMSDPGSEASVVLAELESLGWVHPSGHAGVPKCLGFYDMSLFPSRVAPAIKLTRRATHFFTAWTANGYVARLEIRDTRTPDELVHRVNRREVGAVFNEAVMCAENGSTLFVAESPLHVTLLASRYAALTGRPAQVICADSLPLPQSAHHVRQVILVGATKVSYLVRWMGTQLCEGGSESVAFKVMDIDAVETTGAEQLAQAAADPMLPTVEDRLVELLIERYKRHGFYWIQREMSETAISREQCDLLIDLMDAHDAPERLVQLLSDLWETQFTGCTLASGGQVVSGEAGMVGVTPSGARHSLGNTTISIQRKTVTRDKRILYYCRFTTAQVPSACKLWVERSEFNDPNSLAELITAEYAKRGMPAYVALYAHRMFPLREVADAMAGTLTPQMAEGRLGAISQDILQLPATRITKHLASSRSLAYIDVPESVTRLYSAVRPLRYDDDCTGMPTLWRSAELGGYVLGICHLIHGLMSGLRCASNPLLAPTTQHLVYTDSDATTWVPTVSKLGFTFSADSVLPLLGTVRADKMMEAFEALGELPFIACVSAGGLKAQHLTSSRINTILAADRSVAGELSPLENVTYISLDPLDPQMPGAVLEEHVTAVRAELPLVLKTLMNDLQEKQLYFSVENPVPCVSMYRAIGDIMGWECLDAVADLACPVFDSSTGATLAAFFRTAAQAVQDQQIKVQAAPDNERQSRTHVSEGPDFVWLSKRTVAVVNKVGGYTMDYETVGYLLHAGGYVVEESRHDWKLARAHWDKLIGAQLTLVEAEA